MKRLIGFTALLCLMAMLVGCGGVTSTGTLAYVSNSKGTGFTVYTVNTDGTLTRASISPQTVPASPIQLAFTANGKWAYFLDEAGQNLWGFTRAGDGSLVTQIPQSPYTLGGASAIAIAPSSNFIYVAQPNVSGGQLWVFSIDPSTGELARLGSATVQVSSPIDQLVMASGGGVLYGLSKSKQTVVSWTLTTSNGQAVQSSTQAVGLSPVWMILSANGNYMYVLDSLGTTALPTPNTNFQMPTQPCPTTNNNPNGVPGFCSPNIFGFTTGGNGVLQAMPASPFHENYDLITGNFPSNPIAGVSSPDSKYLFVTNQGTQNISVFRINVVGNPGEPQEVQGAVSTVNGVPTSTASPFDCGSGCKAPAFTAVSGNDNGLYVIDSSQSKIFQFRIDENTGRLRPQNPSSVPGESSTSDPVWFTIH